MRLIVMVTRINPDGSIPMTYGGFAAKHTFMLKDDPLAPQDAEVLRA